MFEAKLPFFLLILKALLPPTLPSREACAQFSTYKFFASFQVPL